MAGKCRVIPPASATAAARRPRATTAPGQTICIGWGLASCTGCAHPPQPYPPQKSNYLHSPCLQGDSESETLHWQRVSARGREGRRGERREVGRPKSAMFCLLVASGGWGGQFCFEIPGQRNHDSGRGGRASQLSPMIVGSGWGWFGPREPQPMFDGCAIDGGFCIVLEHGSRRSRTQSIVFKQCVSLPGARRAPALTRPTRSAFGPGQSKVRQENRKRSGRIGLLFADVVAGQRHPDVVPPTRF